MIGLRYNDFTQQAAVMNITRDSVCYRCMECRIRYPVTHGHPLLRSLGHGSHSLSNMIFAMWGCVEGKSITVVARELDVNENLIARWFAMVVQSDAQLFTALAKAVVA